MWDKLLILILNEFISNLQDLFHFMNQLVENLRSVLVNVLMLGSHFCTIGNRRVQVEGRIIKGHAATEGTIQFDLYSTTVKTIFMFLKSIFIIIISNILKACL